MVYNIWGTVLAMATTGIMMGTPRFFGVAWVEELHEALFGWLVASIVLHFGGIFYDDLRTGVPLVRAMTGGSKQTPAEREIE